MTSQFAANEPAEDQTQLDNVKVCENGESLVDFLELCPHLRFSATHPVFDFPRVHLVRLSVAEMLCRAAAALPAGIFISVVEGYRPHAVQIAMYRHALDAARARCPNCDENRIRAEAGRFSAPPDAATPPPHTTGAAVDLTLVDAAGEELDFWSPFAKLDLASAPLRASGLSAEAQANRDLLEVILTRSGLTSYADEWWHWSYGDNGWALRTGAPCAIYGKIELPEHAHWVGDLSKLPDASQ